MAARGFTLLETMIVVAILGILGALAAPSFVDMIKAARVRSAASDFYSSLLSARSEAIKRRTTITLAPVDGDWAKGWNATFVGNSGPLVTHEALAADLTVRVNPSDDTAEAITYGSNGRITSAVPTLIFYVPGAAAVQARCVRLDPAGMPRTQTDNNGVATDGCS